ncbi:uncharacterized protein LOC141620709 [Silene latifolia]|uniref:uncharacterized protein LOC141620709 n=1 Tax=Silene latifolia TaxID=37657 RepID=UPI003D785A14
MDFSNPEFMNSIRRALESIHEANQWWQPRRGEPSRPVDEFKITELPEFVGGTDPEDYLDWERKIDRMFDFKDLEDEKHCKYAILKLSRGASLWFENLKSQRARSSKAKITSWDSLKRKLRKRYVPTTHRLDLYRKIADLTQGKLSVEEYINEFEKLAMMGELEENEELKMARFLRGLNQNIAHIVELHPYSDFDTLCGFSLKVEAQGRAEYGTSDLNKSLSWSKNDTLEASGSNSSTNKAAVPAITPVAAPAASKAVAPPREQSLMKVRCFKCQGFGHYQNACPNKRNITLREAISVRDELMEEEAVGGIFTFKEVEEEEEGVEVYKAPIYDTTLVVRSLQAELEPVISAEQQNQLFYTKCQVNDRWCSLIIDGGSCTNAASSEMVSKLSLPTTDHPKPYALHWLDDGSKVKLSRQVQVGLTMGLYQDEVLCDVIPMEACHILLGRPWQFDRDVVHRGRSNEYELLNKEKKVILKPMTPGAGRNMHSDRGEKTESDITDNGG